VLTDVMEIIRSGWRLALFYLWDYSPAIERIYAFNFGRRCGHWMVFSGHAFCRRT
jgi:hypothetical protein